MKQLIPWILAGVGILFAAGTCTRLANVERDRDVAQANQRAALDTTRRHLVGENQGLSRLVRQDEIEIDELGALLGKAGDSIAGLEKAFEDRHVRDVALLQELWVAFDSVTRDNASLNADVLARSRSGAAFRVVAIDIEGPPISGDVDISVPADTTQPAEVEFVSLVVAPFDLVYGLGCSGHDAVVVAQAPAHISLELRPGQVDPDVCNPPAPRQWLGDVFRLSPSNVVWAGLGAVVARLLLGG